MELHPGVAYGVTGVVVIGCHHIQEVFLDVVTGVAHVGVAHDNGRSLVGLGIGEHIVAQLTQLTEHSLHVSIALGIAVAAVGVHVGDVYVYDHIVRFIYSHHIVAETFLDAGIGTVVQISLSIIVLHPGLSRSTGGAGAPEEIQSVGIGSGAKGLAYSYGSTPGTMRIIGEPIHQLLIIFEILTGSDDVPSEIIGNTCHCGGTV